MLLFAPAAALNVSRTVPALERFCWEHADAAKCLFADWNPQDLREYVAFHWLQRTLGWTQTAGQITGIGFVWQAMETQVRAAGRFDWTATDPDGDSLVFAEFITLHPPARRALTRHFASRFPRWRDLKLFAFRRGELQAVSPRSAERLLTL